MHIKVLSITSAESDVSIEFDSSYGICRGNWQVGVPTLGREYDVEIELRQPLRIYKNTRPSRDSSPHLSASKHSVTIVSKIEDQYDNGTAILRVGDSLIHVEVEDLPDLLVGSWIEVNVPELDLYDTLT